MSSQDAFHGRTLAITGVTGFVGAHVARIAAEGGARVVGIGRESVPAAPLEPFIDRYVSADLTQGWPLAEDPDGVIHLAGLASVGQSFAQPQRYIEINSAITTHLGEALRSRSAPTRVVVVSSGAVYAAPVRGPAITERDEVRPTSPYAVSKIVVETQAAYYAACGVDMVVARPFNHIGPGQGPGFILPDLLEAIRRAPARQPIVTGDLSSGRDYTDVRDVARAYLALAFAPTHAHAVYNVASGTSRTGREVLSAISRALGIPVPTTVIDAARLRPNDTSVICGSAERLREEFGWSAQLDWQSSVRDFVIAAQG